MWAKHSNARVVFDTVLFNTDIAKWEIWVN